MCYSVLVETDLKRLAREYDAAVDVEAFHALLKRREQGDRSFKVPRGLDAYFDAPSTPLERECWNMIQRFAGKERRRFEEKVAEQDAKIAALEAALAKKVTKTNQQKLDTARRVRDKAAADLAAIGGASRVTDQQIHQYTYAPLLVRGEDGKRLVRPFRYQVRPRWSAEEPNRELNLFNARLDKLEDRRTWAPLFLERHAALVFKGFYEWVPHPTTGKSAVIHFRPAGGGLMWAPALHEEWRSPDGAESIASFAILTTEPPAEVQAMGHDRCPIYPKWSFLRDWLNPKSCTREAVYRGLHDLEPVRYEYDWV